MEVTKGTGPHTDPTYEFSVVCGLNGCQKRASSYVEFRQHRETFHRRETVTVDELRAILAPLLDEPYEEYDGMEQWCRFCESEYKPPHVRQDYRRILEGVPIGETRYDVVRTEVPGVCNHEPDCPVLDRDRLLGREHRA